MCGYWRPGAVKVTTVSMVSSMCAHLQVIAIGREDVWPLHRKGLELGGNVRTGLEDTFYLPDGSRATTNGQLIEALVSLCREMGREPATPEEARLMVGVPEAQAQATKARGAGNEGVRCRRRYSCIVHGINIRARAPL